MARANPIVRAGIAALLPLLACASPSGGGGGGVGSPSVVRFSSEAVTPPTVTIASDGNVRWVNTAADSRGVVVFPASVATRFRCSDLGPYFTRAPDGIRSLPIGDFESSTVQLPCPLAPGSYDYEIRLFGAGFGVEGEDVEPTRVLRARIVVE